MAVELLDVETRNFLGWYETEGEALRDVAAIIREQGRAAVATLALGRDDATRGGELARGEALADLALGRKAAGR